MYSLLSLLLATFSLISAGQPTDSGQRIATGHLPVVVSDKAGAVHLTFGQDSTIYYAIATGQPAQFSQPVAVATLHGLVAGAKRGPQIAVTDKYVVITVVNKIGNLFAYTLDRQTGKWSGATRLNDVPEVAKEGFQAVASASSNNFHAVWLDLRGDNQNKIVGTSSIDGGRTWSANRVIYQSPSGSVCECCRVSITARDNNVYVQFRNWLNGARDLYLAHSTDGGRTYPSVQKLGAGTWKLAGCPMDGGGLALTPEGKPTTAWRRENMLYTCQPGDQEKALATGQNVTLANGKAGNTTAWDDNGTVWLQQGDNVPVALGKGKMPSLALSGKSTICVWEADRQIMMKAAVTEN